MPTPQRDTYEDPVGLFCELDLRMFSVVQDFPELWQTAEQLCGSRRLGQTGKMYVELDVVYNNPRGGVQIVHRWESGGQFARRIRNMDKILPGCELQGASNQGCQRQATWAHQDKHSTTTWEFLSRDSSPYHGGDFIGKPTLLGKTKSSVIELMKYIDTDRQTPPIVPYMAGTGVPTEALLKPLMLKLYVTKRVENFNLPRNAKPNMDLEDINRELGYISPDPKCERPRKDVYQHS
eukprot:CAMPEP_0114325298 /NCGR_PEP_ID=MMETSP0059-20121206/29027_1 /TAXON_ID=36894 /ORGANISM="Pyramimonas parkeae, Strain CCMP726" /LENGTH=235 /DNA_ID=CAMNT_0001454017 /DNA_START=1 /DNA_END=709 /DNA_ORIENTATION=-